MTTLFTIGYEGASLADFIHTLGLVGVCNVLDIRELPQSRRPGFSKKALSAALETAGISYCHSKQLGDPKLGRDAARRGDLDQFREIFSAHMDLPASLAALVDAADMAMEKPTALLCYERQHKLCHRAIVAQRLVALRSFQIQHLGVVSHAVVDRAVTSEPVQHV